MPRYTSSTSGHYSIDTTGPKKGAGPLKVGLDIKAQPGGGDNVNVGMSARAKVTGKSDLSLSTKSKSGKVDKLKVDVEVGDWASKPGDRDDIDFLIVVSGSKGGVKLPMKPAKNFKDLDFRLDINLKGMPLKAIFKPNTVDDLKLVKLVGPDGKMSWGYTGKIDADARLVKLDLSSAESGAKVAELAVNMRALDDHHGDDI